MESITTDQEVQCGQYTGKELDRAILKSQGRTWDGMPVVKLSIDDLKEDALRLFKEKAVKKWEADR